MEQSWLEHLETLLATTLPHVEVGVGDDAAVLAIKSQRLVVTTDALTEGVDFRLAHDDASLIGRKSLAVNLSDIAAMAAEPLAAVVAVVLPRDAAREIADALYRGMRTLADEFNVPLVGGDTNTWDGGLVITVTALGTATPRGVWRRNGAVAGDRLLVTGQLGGSILGHQFTFTPRVREASWLRDSATVHAAIDISDGLSLDLSRLTRASGCGGIIDAASVPIADAARRLDGDPLVHALTDGEDFELLLAVPPDEAARLVEQQPLRERFGVVLTDIGECIVDSGQWLRSEAGTITPHKPRGYEHTQNSAAGNSS
ncbi:MAG: thiamine-phosphate kinase [Thermoguttaceae bacterium]